MTVFLAIAAAVVIAWLALALLASRDQNRDVRHRNERLILRNRALAEKNDNLAERVAGLRRLLRDERAQMADYVARRNAADLVDQVADTYRFRAEALAGIAEIPVTSEEDAR